MRGSLCVAAAAAVVLIAGCSAHDQYARTPYVIATTPTYRSTVRSTDPYIEPRYTQPGLNAGTPAPLPRIPSEDRWDPNDPVATEVYDAVTADPSARVRFLRVSAHRGIVRLQGDGRPAACRRAIAVARAVRGVRMVRDELVGPNTP